MHITDLTSAQHCYCLYDAVLSHVVVCVHVGCRFRRVSQGFEKPRNCIGTHSVNKRVIQKSTTGSCTHSSQWMPMGIQCQFINSKK